MKRVLLVSIALFCAVFLIPLLTAGQKPLLEQSQADKPSPEPSTEFVSPSSAAPSENPSPEPSVTDNTTVDKLELPDAEALVSILVDGEAQEMTLRDFLCGAVAAEMPALYPEEALKAQAVAIRTLVLYAQAQPYHEGALLCSDWEHCLAYTPLTAHAEDWGEQFDEFAGKIRSAVDDTNGMVIAYKEEPIEAVFFAVSDGQTRSAAEVWGAEVPYLQRVESAFDRDYPDGARGHGVGMSQYGARQLALTGLGYIDILKWYYSDVEIMNWKIR